MKNCKYKYILVLSLTLFVKAICYGQVLPTKAQQYDFLKWYLKANKLVKLATKLDHFEGENFHLTEFNELKDYWEPKYYHFTVTDSDIAFIKLQLKINDKIKSLKKDSLKNIDWHKWYDDELPVTHISLPVYSCDGNKAFIICYFHCGALCGNGAIEIYRRVAGKWKRFAIQFWGKWNN